MKKTSLIFPVLNVYYEDAAERLRALEILSRLGIRFPKRLLLQSCCAPWPQTTHVLHADLRGRTLSDCPQPHICAAMVSSGVRFYSVPELEKLASSGFRKEPRYPVFHVPHDGSEFPPELMADVCVPREIFLDYHRRMRDQDVRLMVPRPYAGDMLQVFHVSRLLCDVERFIGPEEIMERYGMGFCYEKAFDGQVIKRVTNRARSLAKAYYDRHHQAVNRICGRHSRVLFLDLHSYTDEIIPPFARVPGEPAPDLCLGTDPRFTPPPLTEAVRVRFGAAGFGTAENRPYSGLYVPEDVLSGSSACDFIGIMLEFNRRTYCRETGETDESRIRLIQTVIRQVLVDCMELD